MKDFNKVLQERGNKLMKLGEHTYWLYRNDKIELPEFEELLSELKELDKDIFVINNELTPEKGSDICPKCKAKLDGTGIKFCGSCGTNIDEFYTQNTAKCISCENIISIDAQFCGICGCKQREDM